MYPLRFQPFFQRYLWGGRRLSTLLNKACGPDTAAESWEIVDYQEYQSQVQFGSLKGKTLNQLVQQYRHDLVGHSTWRAINQPSIPASLQGRFPLLFKFLDADQPLSVQVHPDDLYAAQLNPADLGKTEAWYVLHADPGARIFSGLKRGVTRRDFAAAVVAGQTALLLHSFEPRIGDTIMIPAGTVHALGAGLVIAEIQQTSNATFRVFDWDRVDSLGRSRPLHVEQALEVIRFDEGPFEPIRNNQNRSTDSHLVDLLASCDKFTIKRHQVKSVGHTITLRDTDQSRILVVTRGELNVEHDPAERPLLLGETMLLPAALTGIRLTTGPLSNQVTEFLEITA